MEIPGSQGSQSEAATSRGQHLTTTQSYRALRKVRVWFVSKAVSELY